MLDGIFTPSSLAQLLDREILSPISMPSKTTTGRAAYGMENVIEPIPEEAEDCLL